MYQPVDVLRVVHRGRTVGAVAPAGAPGLFAFEYDQAWVRDGLDLAPALMPRRTRRRTWTFPRLARETYHGMPPLLADSIPDRFGNAVIDAALAREGVRPEQVSAIDRLAYLGPRGMGALTFEPAQGPQDSAPTSIELSQLVTAARDAVRGSLDDDHTTHESLRQLLLVGSSAGGARAKAVVAWNRTSGELRAGNLETPPGFEQWLLKFDGVENTDKGEVFGGSRPYNRIEYVYSLMARDAGISVPETRLLEENGRAHFMVKRFDRLPDDRRLHVQTLCAMDGLDFNQTGVHDYASLMNRAVELDPSAGVRAEVFRRLVFNVVASNNDDHTKNHAFLLGDDNTWTLSPAYDLTYSFKPGNRWLEQHCLGVGGKFADLTRADLLTFADQHDVRGAKAIVAEVSDAVAAWPVHARAHGLDAAVIREVGERLAAVRV